jgi:hypothetical protein
MDDCHFNYITELKKKTLAHEIFVIFRNDFGIFTMVPTSVSFLGKWFCQILT